HEGGDAAVDLVATPDQRGNRFPAQTVPARPERDRLYAGALAQRRRQAFELRQLKGWREILEHGVAGQEGFLKRWGVPGMEVGADFRTPLVQPPQRGRGPPVAGHLIRREVRGSHPESLKQGVETRQLADVFDKSEEHTSELQSRVDLVCRLLLEKK